MDTGGADFSRLVWQIRNHMQFLERIAPTNVQKEKQQFLDHWRRNAVYTPSFTYNRDIYDAERIAAWLQTCQDILADYERATAVDQLRPLYEETVDELTGMHHIITHLGDGRRVQEESTAVYGPPPRTEEVKQAEALLDSIRDRDIPEPQDATDVYAACQDLLLRAGLQRWSVQHTDVGIPSASATQRVINVPHPTTGTTYKRQEPAMVAAHEVSHGLRAANGYDQPITLFGSGAGRHRATEEGLAILLEFSVGRERPELLLYELRKYALRVLAADAVQQGNTFHAAFDQLMRYTNDEELAWSVTARAYRGGNGETGGIAKDHIYYRGLRDAAAHVSDAARIDDHLPLLYVGKYGLHNIDTVRQLLEQNVLNRPERSPAAIVDTTLLQVLAQQISSSNIGGILLPLQRHHM